MNKDYTHIKKEINKILDGQASFLGIDGGNINSKIWICGLEFGSNLDQMERYYNESFVKTKNIKDYNSPYRTDRFLIT